MTRTLWLAAAMLAACSNDTPTEPPSADDSSQPDAAALDSAFQAILDEHGVATAGAAIIKAGEVVWTGYYGEQTTGVPATAETMFNTGSVAKTVASEAIVRLAAAGRLSLDEPMSPHWLDPDLVDDPRHEALTPRIALTHKTGFPNWRYMDPEFKLRFQHDPGTRYGYSGEGLDYVARFAHEKTNTPFDALVSATILEPLDLDDIAVAPSARVLERIVHPVIVGGERRQPFCSDPDGRRCTAAGVWSAADDLATTVEDYAVFMIAVMNGDGVDAELQADRFTIQTSTADDEILACRLAKPTLCPSAQGYGLGWEIFEFGDTKIASHGGSDWSERAMVYFDVATRDGIVLFLNAPSETSVEALIDGMNALDPGSRMATLYRSWIDAYYAAQESGDGP